MDLKTRKFNKEQQFGVLGDGTFPNKLHEAEMRATPGILFNLQFNSVDYLSVGNQQYLVVILTYSGGELYYGGYNLFYTLFYHNFCFYSEGSYC